MPQFQGLPVPMTASGQAALGRSHLFGIFCSASSSGTATVYDNTAASGSPVVASFPLVAGQYYQLPFKFAVGIFVAIGGTSASITVGVEEGS